MNKHITSSPNLINEDRAAQLLDKWGPVLDYSSSTVKPIEEDYVRLSTAILLENQEKWCITEANIAAGGSATSSFVYGGSTVNGATPTFGNADTYAPGDARLPKILIPMIRRTFPELITNEIVGVQPMGGPVGLAWALRYKYEGTAGLDGTTAPGVTAIWPSVSAAPNNEIGYNFLNTGYTGASGGTFTNDASGTGVGVLGASGILAADRGLAAALGVFEAQGNFPQISLSIEKTAVEAGTRRLATKWTLELEQDLKNMNGIDIDSELTNAMSYEIQAEIDREMVIRMIKVCLKAGAGKGYSTWSPASADGRWIAERGIDFYNKVLVEANRIAIRNRRGAANFIIATPRVCTILEMLKEFKPYMITGNVNTQPTGVAKVGSVGGRFNIYRDTRFEGQIQVGYRTDTVEYALLGYKGPEFYDTGIVYCPYIPVMVQRAIDPNNFTPRVAMLTRYGVVDNLFGADLYYHMIVVSGLSTAFSPAAQSVYL
jgi:hypothetical protein